MFTELQQTQNTESDFDEINLIRIHFGLHELLDSATDKLDGLDNPAIKAEEFDEQSEEFLTESIIEYDELEQEEECIEIEPSETHQARKTENEKLYEFKCHVCGQEFSKMQVLSAHCRIEHQTQAQVSCWCGKLLSSWKRLMAHKSKHIQDNDEFACKLCSISYKKKSAFDKHVKTKHGPNAEKFICSQCGKEFKERQILKNHEKIHLPDELKLKHPCSYCQKKFVNSHCLKIHIARVHEKIALHTCEQCGKGSSFFFVKIDKLTN